MKHMVSALLLAGALAGTANAQIGSITTQSGKAYEQFVLKTNTLMYTDRTYTFRTVPTELNNQIAIRTANEDKRFSGTSPLLTFQLLQDSTVYVLYTNLNSTIETAWLNAGNGWIADTFTVPTALTGAERDRLVKHKAFAAGLVVLNGNAGTSENNSMYNVVVVPSNAPPPITTVPATYGQTVYMAVGTNTPVAKISLFIDNDMDWVDQRKSRPGASLGPYVELVWTQKEPIPAGTYNMRIESCSPTNVCTNINVTVSRQ